MIKAHLELSNHTATFLQYTLQANWWTIIWKERLLKFLLYMNWLRHSFLLCASFHQLLTKSCDYWQERDLHTHVSLLGSKTKLRQAVMWQLDPITCRRYQIKNSLLELGIDRSRLTFGPLGCESWLLVFFRFPASLIGSLTFGYQLRLPLQSLHASNERIFLSPASFLFAYPVYSLTCIYYLVFTKMMLWSHVLPDDRMWLKPVAC